MPLIITLWVLDWVVSSLDQTLQILPTSWHPDHLFGFHVPGFGVIFALESGAMFQFGTMLLKIIQPGITNLSMSPDFCGSLTVEE